MMWNYFTSECFICLTSKFLYISIFEKWNYFGKIVTAIIPILI